MAKLKVLVILCAIFIILMFTKTGPFLTLAIFWIEFILFTAIIILGILCLYDYFKKKKESDKPK